MKAKRIIVGMTGASGAILTLRVLEMLRMIPDWQVHLVYSPAAELTLQHETGFSSLHLSALADVVHGITDSAASIASGSFHAEGMLIVPCSMKSLAGIAHGYADNLLLRAADVTLKERRRLVLAVRETPLHQVHLANMMSVTQLGGIIAPPVMTYYMKPESLSDMENFLACRLLGMFGIYVPGFLGWSGVEGDVHA